MDIVNVEVTPLPGIGVRKDFAIRGGRRIGVVSHRDGRIELIVSKADDPDACIAELPLTPDEAAPSPTCSARHSWSRSSPRSTATCPASTPSGSRSDGAPFDGRTLGDTALRTRTGVSVVAVMRGGPGAPLARRRTSR